MQLPHYQGSHAKKGNSLNSSITWLPQQGEKVLITNLNDVMKSQFTDKDEFEPRDNSKLKNLFGVFGLSMFRSKDQI